jgi:hypothetical protein
MTDELKAQILEVETALKTLVVSYQTKQGEIQGLANEILKKQGALEELKKMAEKEDSPK